jgi:hypothetical protein
MMKKTAVLLAAACVMLAASSAGADVIVQYGFADSGGSATTSPDTGSVAANVSAGSVSGGGGSGRGDTSSDPYSDGNTRSRYWDNTSDDSLVFTLDADDPFLVNYTRIVFKIDNENSSIDPTWFVQSSATSGDIATGDITTSIDDNGDWTLADVDLSGIAALQGQDQVTFTVGFRDAGVSQAADTTRIDKIQVEGTVVPEPATMSLLAIGGLGALLRRKRS